ncbi:MAG TPA: ribosomal protein S18-alanine N-acetyltransferase [Terriglobales bacterium]|nr:ribosomal protein S18-alanine N-acetyltransferase [Terriglobales bacterium]
MVRVRQAVAGDVEELVRIARLSATAAQWPRERYEALFSGSSYQNRLALVVEQDSKVSGFIVGSAVADEWEIENVAVLPEARRRGLGSRLLNEFLARVESEAGTSVYLEVRESNRAARGLYQKWGFSEAGRRKSYYLDPQEDALILKTSFPGRVRI